MSKLLLIMKHEFKLITKGKVFIIMTLIGPLLMGALMFGSGYFAYKSMSIKKDTKLAIFSIDDNLVKELTVSLKEKDINLIRFDSVTNGKQSVLDDETKGLIVINQDVLNMNSIEYYSTSGTDVQYSSVTEGRINKYIHNIKLKQLGLSDSDSKWLSENIEVESFKLTEDGTSNNSSYETVMIVTMILAMLIMMTSLIYGLTVARSVLNEKTSKTIEMLMSSTEPRDILLGKVTGVALAGIIQCSVWFLIAFIGMNIVVPLMDLNIPMVEISGAQYLIIFALFTLGYIQILFIYAAFGSAIENEQALGQVQIPVQMILMLPFITVSSIISNPNSVMATVMSYFPLTSPITMTARLLIDSPGPMKLGIAMLILLAGLVVALIFSSKIFRIGILTKGTKKNIIEIIRMFFRSSV